MLWYFEAEPVARLKLFHDAVLDSKTVAEVADAIEAARARAGVRPYEAIPI